jgi:hypothetical protein
MKDLSKEELEIIEQFLEPYRYILEEVLASADVEDEAQKQAWRDWAEDEIVDVLSFTPQQAKVLISRLEKEYKFKNKLNDHCRH